MDTASSVARRNPRSLHDYEWVATSHASICVLFKFVVQSVVGC